MIDERLMKRLESAGSQFGKLKFSQIESEGLIQSSKLKFRIQKIFGTSEFESMLHSVG